MPKAAKLETQIHTDNCFQDLHIKVLGARGEGIML